MAGPACSYCEQRPATVALLNLLDGTSASACDECKGRLGIYADEIDEPRTCEVCNEEPAFLTQTFLEGGSHVAVGVSCLPAAIATMVKQIFGVDIDLSQVSSESLTEPGDGSEGQTAAPDPTELPRAARGRSGARGPTSRTSPDPGTADAPDPNGATADQSPETVSPPS